jgi:plastocyanin
MVDLKFEPKSLEVKVGQTVTWVNKDTAPHNVVNEREGQQPKSELFNEGGKYSFTPTKAGRIAYVCTIHPGMEGTLDVVEG